MTKCKIVFLTFFFGVQLLGILWARFVDVKYFCWVPYDQLSSYSITVEHNGTLLNNEQIKERYRRPKLGRENRSIHNLISIMEQKEKAYSQHDSVNVTLQYCINGHRYGQWVWPIESSE